jgi:diazepam-binding inhibitor (GABA receptor modulating acyl-CoA-binding protein)
LPVFLNDSHSHCLIHFLTLGYISFWSGKSKEEAMSDYITKVKQLLEEAAASA